MTVDTPETWANRLKLKIAEAQFLSFFGDPKVKIVRVQVSATFNPKYDPPASATDNLVYALTPRGQSAITEVDLPFRFGEPSVAHVLTTPVDVLREDEGGDPWIFEVAADTAPAALKDGDNHDLLFPDVFEDIWFIVTYESQASS